MCGILKCIVIHNVLLWVLYFHLNIGHIIVFLREQFRPSEDVIRILLSCFLNCLFFNTTNTIAVVFHYVCVTFYSAQIFLKKRRNKKYVGGGVKKTGYPWSLVHVSSLWLLFAQETQQCKDLQFSSGHLSSISLNFLKELSFVDWRMGDLVCVVICGNWTGAEQRSCMSLQRGKEFGICSFFFSLNVGT